MTVPATALTCGADVETSVALAFDWGCEVVTVRAVEVAEPDDARALGVEVVVACDWCEATFAIATPLPRATSAMRVFPPTRRTNLNLDLRYMALPTFTSQGCPRRDPS